MKTLGKQTRTDRGFPLIRFTDISDKACSLQASSLADYTKPGTSAVWLGREEPKYTNTPTGVPLSPRMHLDRKQVRALIHHLQNWLNKDKF